MSRSFSVACQLPNLHCCGTVFSTEVVRSKPMRRGHLLRLCWLQLRGSTPGGIVGTDGMLSIVLGDRHPLFQEAVRSVLEGEPDLRVVATAGDGNRAVVEAERHRPDVA